MARPTYVLECAFDSNPDDALDDQVWEDISPYLDVRAGVKITRGRSDEFSDIQPSKLTLTLDNRDGRFTPGNTDSDYSPNVVSGKRIRLGLMWPGGGVNFAPNTCTDSTAADGWVAGGDVEPTITASNAVAPVAGNGTHGTFIQWGAGDGSATLTIDGLVAGREYTMSVNMRTTASPAPAFTLTIAGSTVSTTGINTWQAKTLTFTATANTEDLVATPNTTPTSGTGARINALQIEEGPSATTLVKTPGVFTWRFTGDVNEWPLAWQGGPALYASSKVTATDRFKRLGDLGELGTTLDEDILDDIPFAYYPLNEPAGVAGSTASAGDISGNDEAPLVLRQTGAGGTVTFGSTPGVPDFYVDRRTTVAIDPDSEGNGAYLRATLKAPPVDLLPAGSCVNVFAMESTDPLDTGPLAIITGIDGSWFGVNKRTNGNITAAFYNAATDTLSEVDSGVGLFSTTSVMLTAVLDIPSAGNGRITFYMNAVQFGTAVTFTMAAVPTWRVVSVGGRASELFRGYLSHAAFFNGAVSSGPPVGWWRAAYLGLDGAGNTSYGRLNKLCVYTGLDTPLGFSGSSFDPQSVGPQEIQGKPLDAMRLLERTEAGLFFIRGDGTSLLRLRDYRYNRDASLTVAADKLDPEEVTFRGDDFGLVNDVTASRPDGASARIANADSVDASGRRKDSLGAIPTTDNDLRALAAWEANTYGVQRNRITGLKISLLNDKDLISDALKLDLGQKVSIADLPDQAPSASIDVMIEGWEEVISEEEWSMAFNTSPADVWDVWQIGTAGHSEIGTTTRIAL